MLPRSVVAAAATTAVVLLSPSAAMADRPVFTPGEPGLDDPYGPTDGNGGYQVERYVLDLTYDPATDRLAGTATIRAEAAQNLSRFNLDFDNIMTVHEVRVAGRAASFAHGDDDELVVTPRAGLREGRPFTVEVRYDGVPAAKPGGLGFLHTDDGAVVVNDESVTLDDQRVASTWFPANDHPSDKARYDFAVTVPDGLEAVANGERAGRRTRNGWTTWRWRAPEPMTTSASMIAVGEFTLDSYRTGGIRITNAIDPALFVRLVPRTGNGYAVSQESDFAYKRLTRTIQVPAAGAQLSFWVDRHTEPDFDFVFVEAHTAGEDDWTTLPDLNGHTSTSIGFACPGLETVHPFLTHYFTDDGDGTCTPIGTTGAWHAASGGAGQPANYENWTVDLSAFAGQRVEVSISHVTDFLISHAGALVDDITVSTGEGTTSFEPDADPGDGWHASGPPAGSPEQENDWLIATATQGPPSEGEVAEFHLGGRQREILAFYSARFGRYPFTAGGGLVDNASFGIAAPQTRSAFDRFSFSGRIFAERRVPWMTALQWFGNAVSRARYQDVWLVVGLSSYAAFLFYDHEGSTSLQPLIDEIYDRYPEGHEFWKLDITDPKNNDPFFAVFDRSAMGLHQLRADVGDETFFRIMRTYLAENRYGNATTETFFEVAERVSGRDLDALLQAWWVGSPDGQKPPRPVLGEPVTTAWPSGLSKGTGPFLGGE